MDIRNIEYFKQRLMERLNELLLQAEKTISEFMEQTTREIETLDQAAMGAEQAFKLRIRDRESKLIKKVREALKRLEDGTYGICEYCGEQIPIKRLEVRPVTTKCIACKEAEEQVELVFK